MGKKKPGAAGARKGASGKADFPSESNNHEFYHNIISNAADGIMVIQKGKIVFSNKAALKALGRRKQDVEGMAFDRIMERGPGSDNARYQAKYTRPDKSVVIFDVNSFVQDYGGEPSTCVLLRDITEVKRIEDRLLAEEERYKIIFEFSPVGLYTSDMKATFIDGNKAAGDLVGYRREEILGRNLFQLKIMAPESLARVLSILIKGVVLGKQIGPFDTEMFKKDGRRVIIRQIAFPLRFQGRPMVILMGVDVTEEKRTEGYLQKLNMELSERIQELESASKALGMRADENAEKTERLMKMKRTLEELLEGKSQQFVEPFEPTRERR